MTSVDGKWEDSRGVGKIKETVKKEEKGEHKNGEWENKVGEQSVVVVVVVGVVGWFRWFG